MRPEDKSALVGDVFARVAARYDLMNDLMSAGVHRLWKAAMIDWLAPRSGLRLLDVAGGTGDIAFRVLDRLAAARSRRRASSCATSIRTCSRSAATGRSTPTASVPSTGSCADAESLPLPDRSVEAYTIAFGIRNVTRIDRALAEAQARSRCRAGAFSVSSSRPWRRPSLRRAYDLYSFNVLPWLGERVAGDQAAYRYLVESIRRFPDQATFARMIEEAGLESVRYRDLSGGIAAIHSAWRL